MKRAKYYENAPYPLAADFPVLELRYCETTDCCHEGVRKVAENPPPVVMTPFVLLEQATSALLLSGPCKPPADKATDD